MVAQKTYDRQCKQCGKEFVATDHRTRLCSSECVLYRRRANETARRIPIVREYQKACLTCKKQFTTNHHLTGYCSDYCYLVSRRVPSGTVYKKDCKHCGKCFTSQSSKLRTCSEDCKKGLRAASRAKAWKKYYQKPEKRSALIKARRQRYKAAPKWELRRKDPHNMYLIRFTQGNRTYLKVGLTYRTPKQRFRNDIKFSRMSNFEVVDLVTFKDLETCSIAETIIHDATLGFQVNPVIFFEGSVTECRLPSALPQLLSMFESAKAGKLEVCNG